MLPGRLLRCLLQYSLGQDGAKTFRDDLKTKGYLKLSKGVINAGFSHLCDVKAGRPAANIGGASVASGASKESSNPASSPRASPQPLHPSSQVSTKGGGKSSVSTKAVGSRPFLPLFPRSAGHLVL